MAEVSAPTFPGPVLSLRGVGVTFETDDGPLRAVDAVSFDLYPGRTLGVVGESGCGKSVTARAILRIEDKRAQIGEGQILLRQNDRTVDLARFPKGGPELRAIRGRDIALVFQEPMSSFSPIHTVGDQIIEAVRLHGRIDKKAARAKAIEQLAQVGTPHPEYIMGQYAWQLSGGLRQRAMIAMALVCGPAVLIADEPTTALDVTTQAQVLELLRELRRSRSMALMLITHDLGVVAETADDVVVMYLGRVVERAPVGALFHAPQHPYTRALLRSIPSPLAKPRTRLATLRGSVPPPRARPSGCPFHPRCDLAIAGVCDRLEPAEHQVGVDHTAACHLFSGEAASSDLTAANVA